MMGRSGWHLLCVVSLMFMASDRLLSPVQDGETAWKSWEEGGIPKPLAGGHPDAYDLSRKEESYGISDEFNRISY